MTLPRQYPESVEDAGVPECLLAADFATSDGTLTVATLPAKINTAGGAFSIKITAPDGSNAEWLNVDPGTTPFFVWTVLDHGYRGTTPVQHYTGDYVFFDLLGPDIEESTRDRDIAPAQVKIGSDWGTTNVLTPAQITANTDDYAPTGHATAAVLRLSTDASRNLTGIVAPSYARRLVVENIGSFDLVLKSNVTSTAANRFKLAADVTLPANTHCELIYDTTLARWVMIGGVGGGGTVTESGLSLSDVTTDNVTSSAHGFAPKSPADATKFLNGAATPAYAAVKDSDLSVSDVTTNNASTSQHGFVKKLDGNAAHYMDGSGAWSTPSGGGAATQIIETGGPTTLDIDAIVDGEYLKRVGTTIVSGTPSGGGGGGIAPAMLQRTAGDLTGTTGASFVEVSSALRLTVAAAIGDILEFSFNGRVDSVDRTFFMDFATIVSGSVVNKWANAAQGFFGYFVSSGTTRGLAGSAFYTVVSGDISGGNVTVTVLAANQTGGGTGATIEANSTDPLNIALVNHGH